MSRLLISFSGGETSGFMTHWCLTNLRGLYDEIVVVFANTGQENEETLEFVVTCDMLFGFPTVWIESVVYPEEKRSPGHRIVNYITADRSGAVFEAVIAKYGIPNQKFKDCTRSLKLRPIEHYAKSIGWTHGSYDTAIGIRADEIDRISSRQRERRLIYPLISMCPMTKPDINRWWTAQPFRLRLKGYQGNCKWCWKKSLRKHLTLIEEDPSKYEFPRRMEERYGRVGAEFRKASEGALHKPLPDDYKRTFFRGNMSTDDLFAEYEKRKLTFLRAEDDAATVFEPSLDVGAGCEESCEVHADEDAVTAP